MNISDDKAAKFGTKTFWLGVMLLIIMALYQCMRDVIDDLHHTSPSAPKGYMENGYWIPEEVLPTPKPKMEARTYRQETANGKNVEIVTNCREDELVTILEPGETVEIRHVDHGPYDRGSRCSYGFDGKIAPINGHPGMVARPRFENDFFFPPAVIPAEAMGFYVVDAEKNNLTRDYIKRPGGKIYFNNPPEATERITVRMRINLPQGEVSEKRGQIGWDGSTLHLHATRFQKELSTEVDEYHHILD